MTEFFLGVGSGLRTEVEHNFNLQGLSSRAVKNLLFAHQKQSRGYDTVEADLAAASKAEGGDSMFGTPVFGQIVFEAGQYDDPAAAVGADATEYDGIKVQSVLAEMNQTKNIITTSIQGRNGTVKEYISDSDYSLTLTGLLVGENRGILRGKSADVAGANIANIGNLPPTLDRNRLIAILKVPAAIRITSTFINAFIDGDGIAGPSNDWVVMSYSFPQERGVYNAQVFQINLLSDFPVGFNEIEVSAAT